MAGGISRSRCACGSCPGVRDGVVQGQRARRIPGVLMTGSSVLASGMRVSRASHTVGPQHVLWGDLRAQILVAGEAEVTMQGSHSLGVCLKTAVDLIHMQVIL